MEASVINLAMEFTDEVRRLTNLVNLWRGEAKSNADTIDQLRKQLREVQLKDEEVKKLRDRNAYLELWLKDRNHNLVCLREEIGLLKSDNTSLRGQIHSLRTIQKLCYPQWDNADWGHPIVP